MEATGETATLSIPGRDTAVTVDFVQSPSTVRSVAEIGRPSVPTPPRTGKVYLAYAGTLPDGPLHAYTENTIIDRARLEAEVAVVRERGWAAGLRRTRGRTPRRCGTDPRRPQPAGGRARRAGPRRAVRRRGDGTPPSNTCRNTPRH